MKNREVSKILSQFIDKKYALGDTSQGYDCLSTLLEYCRAIGVELPTKFKGFTEKNYAEKWLNGEGREEYFEFLKTLGKEIDVNYSIAGDIFIIDWEDSVTAGIYLGNDHVLICFEKGMKVIPAKFIRDKLVEVRRLCQQR